VPSRHRQHITIADGPHSASGALRLLAVVGWFAHAPLAPSWPRGGPTLSAVGAPAGEPTAEPAAEPAVDPARLPEASEGGELSDAPLPRRLLLLLPNGVLSTSLSVLRVVGIDATSYAVTVLVLVLVVVVVVVPLSPRVATAASSSWMGWKRGVSGASAATVTGEDDGSGVVEAFTASGSRISHLATPGWAGSNRAGVRQ
jgi:hypothetical protein